MERFVDHVVCDIIMIETSLKYAIRGFAAFSALTVLLHTSHCVSFHLFSVGIDTRPFL
jgi:hypothetical protein